MGLFVKKEDPGQEKEVLLLLKTRRCEFFCLPFEALLLHYTALELFTVHYIWFSQLHKCCFYESVKTD